MRRRFSEYVLFVAGMVTAIVSATVPARAAEVWSPNPLVAIFDSPDYAGMDDPDCAIQLSAPLNGAASGQVVVYARESIKGPEARVSALKLKGARGVIPASAIQVRYALPTGSSKSRRNVARFEGLSATPRAQGQVHPVWVTVNVPAAAQPGEYAGKLSVAGREVPIRLAVSAWKLPDPTDFVTHVGIIQSPDSVAIQYQVPLWSQEHWEFIGKSFDQLAKVGNKTIYIPLICKTHFGNPESMVRWLKDGDGFKHDFTIAQRYLDLYIERVGKPRIVCFYVWEPFCGRNYFGKRSSKKPLPPSVSLLDTETGKVEMMEGSLQGTLEGEAFWKPVFNGLREMLTRRGLGDEAFMIGIAGDARPTAEITAMFQRISPYARWVVHSHGKTDKLSGVPVGYLAHVWGVGSTPDPDTGDRYGNKRHYGWKNEFLRTVFPRYGGAGFVLNPPLWSNAPLGVYREIAEATLSANLRGFGRVGADFWPVIKDQRGRARPISGRYPESGWGQLSVTTATGSVLDPGPEGAISTVRFEMLREGIQEAEARVFIEKALDDESKLARLGEAFANTCQDFLDDRIRYFLKTQKNPKKGELREEGTGWDYFMTQSGWQDRSHKLFEVAAQVARALPQSDGEVVMKVSQ